MIQEPSLIRLTKIFWFQTFASHLAVAPSARRVAEEFIKDGDSTITTSNSSTELDEFLGGLLVTQYNSDLIIYQLILNIGEFKSFEEN